MKLRVLFHDNCFDGTASAAVFARFFRERVDAAADVSYLGVQHGHGDPFGPDAFAGDVNACVDFRYSSDPRLTWWFDHHASGFPTPADRAHFEADRSGKKFHDGTAPSNTKFQAGVLAEKFGFDTVPFEELLYWADLIDSASFDDPAQAVELREPALQLMTWVENNHDRGLMVRYIEDLQSRTLAEIAASPYIAEALEPVLATHHRHIELIQGRIQRDDDVVFFYFLDDGVSAHNKFIPYLFHPDALYTVGLTASDTRTKVSVGFNPWTLRERTHHIARICERYGGGGHPVVGAVSLKAGEAARAREIAREIVTELKGK